MNGLLPQFLIEIYPLLALARLDQLESQTDLSEEQRRAALDEIAAIAGKAIRLSKTAPPFPLTGPSCRGVLLLASRTPAAGGEAFRSQHCDAYKLGRLYNSRRPMRCGAATWLRPAIGEEGRGRYLERAQELFGRVGAMPLAARVGSRLERLPRGRDVPVGAG